MTNVNDTNNGNLMSQITSTYNPPAVHGNPSSYKPTSQVPSISPSNGKSRGTFRGKLENFITNYLVPLGEYALSFLTGYQQNQWNIEAEKRANAEYDRRVADERDYNDPQAVAQRYANAGINPLMTMTNGSPITSSTASAPTPMPNNLGGLSGIASLMQAPSRINLNKSKIDNTDTDTILKNWDILLKDQLYNYNNKVNPILLEKAGQELTNLRQTFKNLVSTEGLEKARTSEVYKKMQKLEEEITLLVFQQVLTQENIAVQEQSWRKMVEEISWQKIENQIQYRTLEDFYNSGVFKDKSKAEQDRIRALADKAIAEYNNYAELYNITDQSFMGQFMRRLMWIFDQLSFGANI